MQHTLEYYKLAREVERCSHPLVQFRVRDIHERYDDELLHLDQLLAIEVYRLERKVCYRLIPVEVVALWGASYSSMVEHLLGELLIEWVLDSLHRE